MTLSWWTAYFYSIVSFLSVLKCDLSKVKKHLKTLKAQAVYCSRQDNKFQQDAQVIYICNVLVSITRCMIRSFVILIFFSIFVSYFWGFWDKVTWIFFWQIIKTIYLFNKNLGWLQQKRFPCSQWPLFDTCIAGTILNATLTVKKCYLKWSNQNDMLFCYRTWLLNTKWNWRSLTDEVVNYITNIGKY